LQRKYTQDSITYEILQNLMQKQVLESAKESVLENDRSIKSLILTASAQIDPFYLLKQTKPEPLSSTAIFTSKRPSSHESQ